MYKIYLLSIIFLFICWLLYNINIAEGFQTTAEMLPNKMECDIIVASYRTLELQHKRAVDQDNKELIESSLEPMNTMKDIIKAMNCDI
jgi:hypothetical protein